jgi:hypothetical protein
VAPEARIATFDQDGTLWVEHPIYSQVVHCLDRVPALVKAKPELANATVHDAVVVLKAPKLEGDRLTFAVQVLKGDLADANGPASVFIDTADFEVSALQSMFPSTNWPPRMRH